MRALNEYGPCTVLDLHHKTGVSRQAIYRLLQVLCDAGYAVRQVDTPKFQLTSLILELSDRVRDQERITEIAGPILASLQEKIVWPTSFADFERGQMIVRVTTRRNSPLVFDRSRSGIRLPVLESSLGLAYLAFSHPQTRSTILQVLRQSTDPLDQLAKSSAKVRKLLRDTTAQGYGARIGGEIGMITSSVSVPVLVNQYAIGAVTTTFLSSALTIEEAAKSFLKPLKKAAEEISARISVLPL